MSIDIDEVFKNEGIKISYQRLTYLEDIILKKIILMNEFPIIQDSLRCSSRNEAVCKMRQFFIDPEFVGVMNSEYFAPEIFTLTTKRSNNSHYEGMILNSQGFGMARGEIDIHCATKIDIRYLDLYLGANASKTTFELNKDINHSENHTGIWKTEKNDQHIAGLVYSSYDINEDTGLHPSTKDLNGTVHLEKVRKKNCDANIYHPVMTRFIIDNYKSHLMNLKEQLEGHRR
jgi:hypothetical protein